MTRSTRYLRAVLLSAALAGCQDDPTRVETSNRELDLPRSAPQMASLTTPGDYVDVTAGGNFSCGIRRDATLHCWGANEHGQRNAPAGTFIRVDAAVFTSNVCAIRTDGSLVCWGETAALHTPPSGAFTDVSVGLSHACALATDSSVKCWGEAFRGRTIPPADADFIQVATGFEYSCGLKAGGTIACWGFAGAGQMNTPTHLGPFTAVSAAYASTCAIRSTGELVCWGRGFGGVGGETDPPDGGVWHGLDGGSVGACALDEAGNPACWSARQQPRDVVPGPFVSVDQGAEHACAVTAVGTVTCWGNDADNRLDPNNGVPPNQPPTATLQAPTSVTEGSDIAISLTNVTDESAATVSYAFDCGSGFGAAGSVATATCPTSDDGTIVVRGRVTDDQGLSSEYSASVSVLNAVPKLSAIAGATIMAGETYSATGSFTDPGADSHTASVNYGSGSQSLALKNSTFKLAQTYAAAGTYTVTVSITDDDGGIGSGNAKVIVQSPAQATDALADAVSDLMAAGTLQKSEAKSLNESLQGAIDDLEAGKSGPAANKLNAFKNKVDALVKSGRLPAATADELKGYANRIIASMKK